MEGLRSLSLAGPGVLRFFLASMVILYHSSPLSLGNWAVYVFFILSGYWVSLMWNQKYRYCRQPFLTFLISRYWRILPLLILCSAISIAIVALIPGWFPYGQGLIFDAVWWLREFFVVGSSRQPFVLVPAWSLDVEMEFYWIAPVLVKGGLLWKMAGQKKSVGILSLMGVALLLLWIFFGIKTGRYFSFFFAGVLAYTTNWRPSRRFAQTSLLTFTLLVVCLLLSPPLSSIIWATPDGADKSHLEGFSTIAAFIFLPCAIYTVHQTSSRMDRSLGDLAYSSYIFHWIVVEGVKYFQPELPFYLAVTTKCGLSLVGAILLYKWVDVPSERARKSFIASRVLASNKS